MTVWDYFVSHWQLCNCQILPTSLEFPDSPGSAADVSYVRRIDIWVRVQAARTLCFQRFTLLGKMETSPSSISSLGNIYFWRVHSFATFPNWQMHQLREMQAFSIFWVTCIRGTDVCPKVQKRSGKREERERKNGSMQNQVFNRSFYPAVSLHIWKKKKGDIWNYHRPCNTFQEKKKGSETPHSWFLSFLHFSKVHIKRT